MKKLIFSLMLVVLTATVGLGWGIDSLFKELQDQQASLSTSDEITPYREMGLSLASALNKGMEFGSVIDHWPDKDNGLMIKLLALHELPLPASLQQSLDLGKPLILESEQSVSLHFLLSMQSKILTLTIPKTLITTEDASLQLILTSFFYFGVLVIVLIWLYPLIIRLRRLATTVKALGEGQLEQRIKVERRSYISDIEKEFNRMAQRIATLIEDNKLLGNAVSHDLRTPLARLRFGIEALQETTNPEKQIKYQQHISRDIDEMEKLVEVLLNYARLDQAMIAVKKRAINFSALVERCVHTQKIDDKLISYAADETFTVEGDENYLRMLVNNLVTNAIQYAKTRILVSLTTDKEWLILTVEDDGLGIPESERDKILKPFTRLETNQDVGAPSGYGMGLAIVARIAQWHQATLDISSSTSLGGAKFTLSFKSLSE
ncbi:ATP-binding protein [Thalassotalea fusca]